jgi:ABC-type molybdate transport system substrate-binding protein
VSADYPIAVVKNAPKPAAAKAFVDYVSRVQAGQATLQKYGLIPVNA